MDTLNRQKIKRFAIALVIALLIKNTSQAQMSLNLDEVPMDIAYYRTSKLASPLVKVIYGRPSKSGKKVFGEQVLFNKIWKTGANETTEIKFYQDVMIGNTSIPAGTYALYTIPGESEWEIIISSNLDLWGSNQYDSLFDIAKITVPVHKAEMMDVFSIWFKSKISGIEMVMSWDKTRINLPISLEKDADYAIVLQ